MGFCDRCVSYYLCTARRLTQGLAWSSVSEDIGMIRYWPYILMAHVQVSAVFYSVDLPWRSR